MHCTQCGTPYASGEQFCTACGARLSDLAPPGATAPLGAPLGAPPGAPPPPGAVPGPPTSVPPMAPGWGAPPGQAVYVPTPAGSPAAPPPYGPMGAAPPGMVYVPVYAAPTPGTNGMAIASMILGILWVYWVGSVLAVIFGFVALNQIKKRNESGRGMAIAGLVLGFIGVGLLLVVLILVAVASTNTPSGSLVPPLLH